jgi:hypothetical protein
MFGTIIKLICPHCQRRLRDGEGWPVSTSVYDRTCPRCRSRWRVIVRPLAQTDAVRFHQVDWTEKPEKTKAGTVI